MSGIAALGESRERLRDVLDDAHGLATPAELVGEVNVVLAAFVSDHGLGSFTPAESANPGNDRRTR